MCFYALYKERQFMSTLKSKDLLIVAPNTHDIINDQTMLISTYFNKTNILVSVPYFSKIASNLPYFKKDFGFLRVNLESNIKQINYNTIYSKFFTLPIEVLQKRNCILEAKNCIKTLARNPINFSLIHAHFLYTGFIGAELKNVYRKPFVVTAHGGDIYDLPFRDKWYNTIARYVLNEADQVITVSQFNAEKILSLGVSSKKIHVIPNGYDEKLFKPFSTIAARKKLRLPLNKKILLSIGNLVDAKGHTYLIDAMRMVLKKRNDVILVIVGSGPLKEPLQRKTRELGLEGKILFIGQKKHEEIPVWMNACDVFVLPSLCESFGVVIIEALACGKPVVATRIGGIPEIIIDKGFGILVEPACPLSLSEGLLDALERKRVHSKITLYAKKYSWASIVPNILKVYNDVLTASNEQILT